MVLIISIYSLYKITSRITDTRFVLFSRRLALYFLAFRSFPTHPPKTAVLSPNGSAINCPDMAQTWLWSRDYCVWDKLNVTSVKEKLLTLAVIWHVLHASLDLNRGHPYTRYQLASLWRESRILTLLVPCQAWRGNKISPIVSRLS